MLIPSAAHVTILYRRIQTNAHTKPSTAALDDLHLFLIACLKSISPSAALSVALHPRLSFHLFIFFLFPSSVPKGSYKTP